MLIHSLIHCNARISADMSLHSFYHSLGKFNLIPVDRERDADYTLTEHTFLFMKNGVHVYGSAELCHIFPMTALGVNIVGLRGRLILLLGRMIFEDVVEG